MTLTVLEYALGNALLALPLAALAWTIGRTRRNPSVAHFAWVLVMIRLVMPPIASVPWLSIQVPVSAAIAVQPSAPRAADSSAFDSRVAEQPTESADDSAIGIATGAATLNEAFPTNHRSPGPSWSIDGRRSVSSGLRERLS